MRDWNPYTKWWIAWGVVGAIIEGFAIADHSGGTLSSTTGRLISHPAVMGVFVVGWLYLLRHFIKSRPK